MIPGAAEIKDLTVVNASRLCGKAVTFVAAFCDAMRYTEEQKQTADLIHRITETSPYGIKGFYRTYAWKKKRMQILARDRHACQECRKHGRYTEAVLVHHIKHLQDEPALALTDDNLESVCKECHEKLHLERNRHKQNFVNEERW